MESGWTSGLAELNLIRQFRQYSHNKKGTLVVF
jgi:hypothetical protein